MSLFCYALLCVHSSFAIILKRKRKLVALLSLSYRCICYYKCSVALPHGAVSCLQYVIVVFPDHTQLLLVNLSNLASGSFLEQFWRYSPALSLLGHVKYFVQFDKKMFCAWG